MAIELVKEHFKKYGLDHKILEYDASSATVELAANALGVKPERIAKTLAFKRDQGCILIVAAGDAKIDNAKFKHKFGIKARMLSPDEVLNQVGHAIGGVCPFGIPENIPVFLDESLKRFETVFPACGSSNSAIELSCEEVYIYSNAQEWVDVCKGWQ
ncbi:YbaK/EbsC family protein [Rummeliibacillus suwonensis]|uniref:YbaK/EbsC family protein n=1 Tax=Rummeliibacillus suwonensis TaxID=1306154 RepID=UPI0011B76732|nr:YbaK/EbsC family protein [Rummeliibacillus suwonensis]MBO2535426.1 YbaK/EbsC family protein [Rummeliibacillus suwonensis]